MDLANKIPVPKQNKSFHDYMPKTNECNLFLSPVLQEDIITTVNNCKSKTSCDHNNIDMVIIPPSHRRRGANAVLVRHKPQCHRHDRRGSAVVSSLIAVKPRQIVKTADIRSPYISVTPGLRCDCGACTA